MGYRVSQLYHLFIPLFSSIRFGAYACWSIPVLSNKIVYIIERLYGDLLRGLIQPLYLLVLSITTTVNIVFMSLY